ncbi:toxin HipA [Actinomycetota bacterium]|nr:toxin HipA [Actinomycetota bacterium]
MPTFKHAEVVEVRLDGVAVGAISQLGNAPYYAFEYYPKWINAGFSISPLYLPLRPGAFTFPALVGGTWHGLPAAIADALPDRFGNSLIEAKMAELGVSPEQITPLDRLTYVADRAIGALEFCPPQDLVAEQADLLDIAGLVTAARSALGGDIATDLAAKDALQSLISVGVSAGGARAKAIVNIDPTTQEISSGQYAVAGKEPWILKFDGVGSDKQLGASQEYGRIEFAYSRMAAAAGIAVPQTRLLEEGGRAHFMSRRFDRIFQRVEKDGELVETPRKLHLQTLCALGHIDFNLLQTNSYSQLFMVFERLGQDGQLNLTGSAETARCEAFRRMVFNYLAMNCDDHSKNFSFIADGSSGWRLAPAYDITFAYNPQSRWLKEHLMSVDGKFSDVTTNDFLAFARRHKVPYAKRIIKEVSQAIADWPSFAKDAGISKPTISKIAKLLI